MKLIKTITIATLGLTFFSSSLLAQGGCCEKPVPKKQVTSSEGGCCGDKTTPTSESTPKDAKISGKKGSHANSMMQGYNSIATALYKDDLAAAKKAAATLAQHDKKNSMARSSAKIAKSSSITEARKNFLALSKTAIKSAKGDRGWNVMHCSMAFDNKGASWLQKSSKKRANNPYFGNKMPHCGRPVK